MHTMGRINIATISIGGTLNEECTPPHTPTEAKRSTGLKQVMIILAHSQANIGARRESRKEQQQQNIKK